MMATVLLVGLFTACSQAGPGQPHRCRVASVCVVQHITSSYDHLSRASPLLCSVAQDISDSLPLPLRGGSSLVEPGSHLTDGASLSHMTEHNVYKSIRRHDSEFGCQQYGRVLAQRHAVRWEEFWPFLGRMSVLGEWCLC